MKRPMGEFVVEQRTKDAMFNATTLLKHGIRKMVSHKENWIITSTLLRLKSL